MKFDNRPPINLEDAEQVASAKRDGGSYDGIGFNVYRVYRGKKYHLVHLFNSGCDYGSGTHTSRTHLGHWESVDDLAEFLRQQRVNGDFPWWASELLEGLEVPTEEA